MPQSDALLRRLLDLIQRLYAESDGFLDNPHDEQQWYNRGYANGMITALTELGYAAVVQQCITPDAADCIAGHEALSWGRAYRHGMEMGDKETREVIGPAQSA